MKASKTLPLSAALAALLVSAALPLAAHAGEPEDLIKQGAFYGDIRYRYERVDQDGLPHDAVASTLRTRAGFKTGVYENFQGLFELDLVGRLGKENYNDGKNGKTTYPVIADPLTHEINQAWVSWAGLPQTTVRIGRQVVVLDNQRFIGASGWRQNDQTFDVATVENKSVEDLTLFYGFSGNVNRVFGHDHPQGDWDMRTHMARAAYAWAPWLNIAGYGYWLDIDLAPASSSRTFGVRLTGEEPVSEGLSFFYEAEAAEQHDHGNNPVDYDATYFHLSPGLKWGGLTLAAGFESLEGDGVLAFQTPLASLHAFNGWADKFLTTPANGLEDAYARISYKVSGAGPWLDDTVFDAVYHDFGAENTGADYGDEWNVQIGRTFKTEKTTYPFKEWSFSVKYADYDADDLFTDTQKVWLSIGTKF